MDLKDIMTTDVVCCEPNQTLREVARMMRDGDVGEIPVIEDAISRRVIGVVTDRDIVVRVLAEGTNPLDVRAEYCMTAPAVTAKETDSLEEVAERMASEQIRRIPIVDAKDSLCGIVALADLVYSDARSLRDKVTRRVAQPH